MTPCTTAAIAWPRKETWLTRHEATDPGAAPRRRGLHEERRSASVAPTTTQGRHDRKGHRRLVLAGARPQSLTVPDPTEVRSGECTRLGRLGGGETIGDDAAEVVTESRRARQSSGSKALPLSRVIARKESPIGPEHAGKVETRHDRINNAGNVNIRHDDRLHHIGIGRTYPGRASSSSLRTARSASSTPSPASSERAHPRPAPRLPAPTATSKGPTPK
jgi:hypothetical protein